MKKVFKTILISLSALVFAFFIYIFTSEYFNMKANLLDPTYEGINGYGFTFVLLFIYVIIFNGAILLLDLIFLIISLIKKQGKLFYLVFALVPVISSIIIYLVGNGFNNILAGLK